jgi:hypothetical protein
MCHTCGVLKVHSLNRHNTSVQTLRFALDMFRYLLCVVLLCVVVAEEGKCALQEEDDGEEGVEDYDLDDDADYEDEEDLYDDGYGEDEDYEYDEDDDDPDDYEYEYGHFVHGEL